MSSQKKIGVKQTHGKEMTGDLSVALKTAYDVIVTSWWPQFGFFWVSRKVYIMFDVHIGFRPQTIIFVDFKKGAIMPPPR